MSDAEKTITIYEDDQLLELDPAEGTVSPSSAALSSYRYTYSPIIGNAIATRLASGDTLAQICRPPWPSYATVARWRRQEPDFAELIDTAYKDRAHFYHDRVVDVADALLENGDKDRTASLNAAANHYRWLASVGNNARFGPKQVSEQVSSSTTIIKIDTGIRRPGDEGYIIDERFRDVEGTNKQADSGGGDQDGLLPEASSGEAPQ